MKGYHLYSIFVLFCIIQIGSTAITSFEAFYLPPVFARVEDDMGELVESVAVQKYAVFPRLILKSNATDVSWSISPKLPEGLSLYEKAGKIVGTPTESIGTTEFTIMAQNKDGNATTTLSITITGCEYGDFLVPRIYGSRKGHFTIMKDNTILYSNVVTSDDNVPVCIKPGTYSYSFNCTYSPVKPFRCSFRLEDEHATHYLSLYSLFNEPVSGTFEMIPSKLPVLSMPSVIAAYPDQHVLTYISIQGIYENITITPDLPSPLKLDMVFSGITGKAPDQGLYNFTVTALNKLGSTSIEFFIGVDTCPESYDWIIFRRKTNTVFDTIKFSDANGLVLFDNDFSYEKAQYNFCLKEGTYQFQFGYTNEKGFGWDEIDPLMIFEGDELMSNYILDLDVLSDSRSFTYSNIVKKGSNYRYSFAFAEKWRSLKFKDHDWSEGSHFSWPSVNKDSKLYLRKLVSVSSLDKYSFIHLDLVTSENTTMYLNERTLLTTAPLMNSTRFTFAIQELVEGTNILAIELKQTSMASDITFDMRIQLVTSGCLLQSINGTASENHPDPSSNNKVDKAFDLNPLSFWIVRTFPAIAKYTFAGSSRHVMNHLMMMNTKYNFPTKLRIQAVDGDSVVDLGSFESKTFMQKGTYQHIYFENTKAYPAYQVVFEKVLYNQTMQVFDIRFLACNPLTCPKSIGKPSAHLTTALSKSCPLFKVGTKLVKCRNVDNRAVWVEDLTYCVSRYPKKSISFLDWRVRLYNATMDAEENLRTSLTTLIMKNLRVQENEIGYVWLRDVSTDEIVIVDVDIRFTFDLEIGDYILKHLKQLIPIFNDQVKIYFEKVDKSISGEVVGSPALRTPVNVALIVSIVLVVIILLLVGVYAYVRMRKNPSSKPRQLHKTRRVKTDELQSLIAEV